MPCTYSESPEEIKASQDKANAKLIAPWKAKLNRVTRLLCEALTAFENANSLDALDEALANNKDLKIWWEEHKAADAKKKK